MGEPERTDLISLAIFGVMGLVSQTGLPLAPWAVTRGSTPRIIAALLMAPSGIFLSIFAYEGFARYASEVSVYPCGAMRDVAAYVALAPWRFGAPSPTSCSS